MSTTDTAPTPAPAKKKESGTEYIVLQQREWKQRPHLPGLSNADDDVDVTSFSTSHVWAEVTRVTALSAEAAVRTIADQSDAEGAVVAIAIPARSWKPLRITVESKPVVKLEDA